MLTLPSDLTPQQWRLIDVEVWKHLHDEPVEWRWCYKRHGTGELTTGLSSETISYLDSHGEDRFYQKHPCTQDEHNYWQPIPSYSIPGPGNTEVMDAMLEVGDLTISRVFDAEAQPTGEKRCELCTLPAPPYEILEGIGPDIPRAILACACDAWGIGIPEAQP